MMILVQQCMYELTPLSGLLLCHHYRRRTRVRAMAAPVVAVVVNMIVNNEADALKEGVKEFLCEPFNTE